MKRILVPTDFSINAYNALLYATRLFGKSGAHITILHTIEEVLSTSASRIDIGKSEEIYNRLHKETQSKFKELLHSITRDTEDYDCTFETRESTLRIHKAIRKNVKEKNIDLIVMGTKGASGIQEVLIGSQAVRVVKKIDSCPLLLVPHLTDFARPKQLCFATDFKAPIPTNKLSLFKSIANSTDSAIHIAHIYTQQEPEATVESNYKKLKQDLGDSTFNTHWIANKSTKAKALQEFIIKNEIDLLAMMYNKHGVFQKLFREPVIKSIGFHSQIPFLIIPA